MGIQCPLVNYILYKIAAITLLSRQRFSEACHLLDLFLLGQHRQDQHH